jgi:hypothetical protein
MYILLIQYKSPPHQKKTQNKITNTKKQKRKINKNKNKNKKQPNKIKQKQKRDKLIKYVG